MLTNTVNQDIYRMTQNALNSLHNSEGSENFNVVLVETNKDYDWSYNHVNFYLKFLLVEKYLNYLCIDRLPHP